MNAWVERLRREAVRWAGEGVDLLFPPRCAICRCDLDAKSAGPAESTARPSGTVCPSCTRDLTADGGRCLRCGELGAAGGAEASANDACRRCRGRRPDWDGITVLASYGDPLRQSILRGKRPGGDDVSRALATLLVDKQRGTFAGWRIDGVVPVPMHWLRRAARGTSAADEIARQVARLLGVPLVVALSRQTATRMQNELPVHERPGNVARAFRLRRAVAGRRLLLVDDVVTTGATFAACRRTLATGDATAVFVAAIAKADRGGDETAGDGGKS
ncbi:MAG: phosphoribosyltransferase family protein [Planctomycetota bacterium]